MLKKLIFLYLLILPLMSLPRLYPLGAKIQYVDIVFVPIFLLWCFQVIRNKKPWLISKGVFISLILLIIVNLFSFLGSIDISKSLIDYLGLLYLAALFIVFSFIIKEKSIFKSAINIIFLVSIVASIIGLISLVCFKAFRFTWIQNFLLISQIKASIAPLARIKSTFLTPEMFITFMQLGLVCGLILFEFQEKARRKVLSILGILIILLASVFAYSRPLTGLFLLLAFAFLVKKGNKLLISLKIFTTFLFVVLLLGAIISSIWMIYPVTISKDKDTKSVSITFQNSPDIRGILRKAAFSIGLKKPFFGIGQGMFTYDLKNHIDLETAGHTLKTNDFSSNLEMDPHSTYFGALAETGFLGLGAMMLFLVLIITTSLKSIKESIPSKYRNAEIYLLVSLIGYLIIACFTDIFAFRQFWINIALLTSVGYIARNNDQ